MAKGSELVNEALGVLSQFNTMIEERIIKKASTHKPQVVSIAQKFVEISNKVSKIFELAGKKLGELEDSSLRVEPNWSLTVFGDRIIVTRHKPLTTSISYIRNESKILVITRNMRMELTPGHVVMQKLGMKIDVDPSNPEDILGKLDEVKYLLREFSYVIDLMSGVAEKRLA